MFPQFFRDEKLKIHTSALLGPTAVLLKNRWGNACGKKIEGDANWGRGTTGAWRASGRGQEVAQ